MRRELLDRRLDRRTDRVRPLERGRNVGRVAARDLCLACGPPPVEPGVAWPRTARAAARAWGCRDVPSCASGACRCFRRRDATSRLRLRCRWRRRCRRRFGDPCDPGRIEGRGPGRGARRPSPTPGTGLPPMRRSSSNSHSYSAWNSWNESLESTVAATRLAIWRTKASPRPTAPAGGVTSSLAAMASSNSARSDLSMRCPNVASTTTERLSTSNSSRKARTASSS